MLLITGVCVNKCTRKLSGLKTLHVMGFYIETISGLQSDSSKGPVESLLYFLFFCFWEEYHFFNVGEKKVNATMFLQR